MSRDKGYRNVQRNGQITLPKKFREDNNIETGDKILWKRHSTNNSKLIIMPEKEASEE